MKYLSVCSGIEAATCAWHNLGFRPIAFSEIEKFPCAVLQHHYPTVPNMGDMTKYKEWSYCEIDILVGGTPCQSFSVAGLRKGLEDPRGNLMLTFLGIADKYKPQWIVWENVPGVLSSGKGRDFGTFLGALAELGYGWAYRVLDAQYFGVPQRRRRVFVVGCLGDFRRAASVLFEPESLSRNLAPSRKTGEGVAGTVKGGSGERGYPDPSDGNGGGLVEIGITKGAAIDRIPEAGPAYTLDQTGAQAVAFNSNARPDEMRFSSVPDALTKSQNSAVAFTQNQAGDVLTGETAPAMGTNSNATGRNTPKVQSGMQVRRLTPKECERLQGFPDDYTLIPWRGGMSPEGPRYKALGNSMAVPVMRWIGKRIAFQEILR